MRRALFEQPFIIAGIALAPAGRGVIARLLDQHREIVFQLDHAIIVVTHTGSVMAEDDMIWRRPTPGTEVPVAAAAYAGPPAGEPAAADWQPTRIEPVTAPRPLPRVDHDAIDDAEYRARWVTYAIGFAGVAVLLIMACSRMLY
jgi:hypothetical protein